MDAVGLLADIHTGCKGRNQDIISSLKVARAHFTAYDLKYVFVLGDLFHDRQAIATDTLVAVYQFLDDTKNKYDQEWIILPGNHDLFLKYSWNINSLIPLRNLATVIDDVKIVDLEGRRFWVLPFIELESSYMKVLHSIEEQYIMDDILLTHIGVRSAALNVCFLIQNWSHVTFEDSIFGHVYTGHFHLQQQVGNNVYYPGSLIPFKFDEGDSPHGPTILDLQTLTHKSFDIWEIWDEYSKEPKPPQFKTINEQSLDQIDPHSSHVKIRVGRDYSPQEKNELIKKLRDNGAKSVTFVEVKQDTAIKAAAKRVSDNDSLKLADLLPTWFDSDTTGNAGLRRQLIVKLNYEIMSEGDELFLQESSDS